MKKPQGVKHEVRLWGKGWGRVSGSTKGLVLEDDQLCRIIGQP